MPHHEWGDSWKHWDELYCAIESVQKIYRIFRIGTYGKEKYGTYRDHPFFWDGGLYALIWPSHVRITNKFIYKLDRYVIKPLTKYTGIHKLGIIIQKVGYNYAFQRTCKLHPNVIDELVSDASMPHWIKPGIFGDIDGEKIHNKYWRKVICNTTSNN